MPCGPRHAATVGVRPVTAVRSGDAEDRCRVPRAAREQLRRHSLRHRLQLPECLRADQPHQQRHARTGLVRLQPGELSRELDELNCGAVVTAARSGSAKRRCAFAGVA